jgi:hypothetical protein
VKTRRAPAVLISAGVIANNRKPLTLAALLFLTAALIIAVRPAPAFAAPNDRPADVVVALADDKVFFPDPVPDHFQPILSYTMTLAAGETRRLEDRLEVLSSVDAVHEVDNVIQCVDASGTQVGVAFAAGTNNQGSLAGDLDLYGSLLFTASDAGVYTCSLLVRTPGSDTSYYMTARKTYTSLLISAPRMRSAHTGGRTRRATRSATRHASISAEPIPPASRSRTRRFRHLPTSSSTPVTYGPRPTTRQKPNYSAPCSSRPVPTRPDPVRAIS